MRINVRNKQTNGHIYVTESFFVGPTDVKMFDVSFICATQKLTNKTPKQNISLIFLSSCLQLGHSRGIRYFADWTGLDWTSKTRTSKTRTSKGIILKLMQTAKIFFSQHFCFPYFFPSLAFRHARCQSRSCHLKYAIIFCERVNFLFSNNFNSFIQ